MPTIRVQPLVGRLHSVGIDMVCASRMCAARNRSSSSRWGLVRDDTAANHQQIILEAV